jgi:hypothetical protein
MSKSPVANHSNKERHYRSYRSPKPYGKIGSPPLPFGSSAYAGPALDGI